MKPGRGLGMIDGFTATILAGGESSRFGSDKAFARWEGRPVILRLLDILRPLFDRCLVVTKRPASFLPFAGPGVEVVAPLWRGWPEPLCAVYAASCLPALEPMLSERGASPVSLLRRVRARFVPEADVVLADPGGLSFEDMDTLEDLRRLAGLAQDSLR